MLLKNMIAKKLSISLDTIAQKTYKTKFNAVIGDSIEITINLTENRIPKDITGTTCRFIGVKSDESVFEQTEGITYIDEKNGIFKVNPNLSVFNVEGEMICSFLIEDEDETINVQKFSITVIPSLITDSVIENSKENVATLAKLNKLLDDYRNDLIQINNSVNVINNQIATINNELVTINDGINNSLNQMNKVETRVNNVEVTTTKLKNVVDSKTIEVNDKAKEINDKVILATQKKTELEEKINNANQKKTELVANTKIAVTTNDTLENTINSAKADIDKINATGNKSLIISASQFVNNEYTWTHNMNSENLTVNIIDVPTKEPLNPDYKIVDKNNILIRNSADHPNVKVVLSASYYQGNSLFGTNVEEFADDSIGINEKSVRLKDGNGTYQNPVTNSDSVFMSDGKTKLTKKVDDISTQLEQKRKQITYNKITNGVEFMAHRGANNIAPENTLIAFDLAGKLGYKWIETDVCKTQDGIYIIMHDSTLDRTTNGTGTVSNVSYNYINSLIIDNGYNVATYSNCKIPTLQQTIDVCKKYGMNLNIHIEYILETDIAGLLSIIIENGYLEKTMISSYKKTLIEEVRRLNKDILVTVIGDSTQASIDYTVSLGNAIMDCEKIHCDTLQKVKNYHNAGLKVAVYTVNTRQEADTLISYGVDYIMTDHLL